MEYEMLLLDITENVAVITLNRPNVLNSLNAALLRELDDILQGPAADPTVRVVVLRGAGPKAFAAGADIGELAEVDATAGEQTVRSTQRIFRRLETLGKPVVACIDGLF